MEAYNRKRIERRIARLEQKIKYYKDNKYNLSNAGWMQYGYYSGRLSELEDILDALEENNAQTLKDLT